MSASDPLVGQTLADRFEIIERIGEGGTGVVYRAKQLSVDRIIAIKVLGAHVSTDPSWVKRFHNEARAASRLDHPNTVRLIDFGQTKEGLLFIAMEYLHGRSLRAELDRVGRMPPNRALRIVSQMCSSLAEAHNQGIIHRDIKPDNVYLVDMKGAGDYVKVLDFSVAKLDAPDAQVTRAGVVFGTPQYMSPEQGRGIPLDPRSDIYAVGIVAYEMLNGRPPFDAKIPTEVVMMHLREKPAPLTGLPPQVVSLVMKALEKDPNKRQQSAEALDQECQACLAELFPRQTPGAGSPASVPAALAEQRTMMAMEAPRLPSQGAPPPAGQYGAPPPAGQYGAPPSYGAPPPAGQYGAPPPAGQHGAPPPSAGSEQRTMMAMEAPRLPQGAPPAAGQYGAPPPSAHSYGAPPAAADQRTMMAMEAPHLPPGRGTPLSEQKTMMGMEAPRLAGGLAPPPSAGPPPAATPGYANQKTMMAQPNQAPQQQKTMMAQPGGIADGGTQILPDSAGVVAYASERARQARHAAAAEVAPAAPAGALFWLAWVLVGLGAGLGAHFYLMAR